MGGGGIAYGAGHESNGGREVGQPIRTKLTFKQRGRLSKSSGMKMGDSLIINSFTSEHERQVGFVIQQIWSK